MSAPASRDEEFRIDVWVARLSEWEAHVNPHSLSGAETARASAYVRDEDRVRFTTARWLLRRLLASYLDGSPGAVEIEPGRFGKPMLAKAWAKSGLSFNVSRSGDLAAFAFAVGTEVGIDVESNESPPLEPGEAASVADSFTAEESALVRSLPPAESTATFLRLWVCKEACLKCLGTGLATPLDAIAIRFSDRVRATGSLGAEELAVHGFDAGGDAVAAVAVRGTRVAEPRVVRLVRD